MQVSNPFETTNPEPEPGLHHKTRLIMSADLAATGLLLMSWLALGVVPDSRAATIVLLFMLAGTLTFASGCIIGWLRFDPTERDQDRLPLMVGMLSFGVALLVLAFPVKHLWL